MLYPDYKTEINFQRDEYMIMKQLAGLRTYSALLDCGGAVERLALKSIKSVLPEKIRLIIDRYAETRSGLIPALEKSVRFASKVSKLYKNYLYTHGAICSDGSERYEYLLDEEMYYETDRGVKAFNNDSLGELVDSINDFHKEQTSEESYPSEEEFCGWAFVSAFRCEMNRESVKEFWHLNEIPLKNQDEFSEMINIEKYFLSMVYRINGYKHLSLEEIAELNEFNCPVRYLTIFKELLLEEYRMVMYEENEELMLVTI